MFPAINLYNGDLPASAQELKMSQLGLEIDVTDERGCGNDHGESQVIEKQFLHWKLATFTLW